jgi:pSer/pThr/pTyr-binding forkhead associated (FHA) protein
MRDDLGQFLEACGANGPLRVEWDDAGTGRPVRRLFDRPAIVVGRNRRADLFLDHPLVGRRHAYFQVVDGRLFAIDLGSREGLRWSGVPRRTGWVDGARPVQVGPTTIRVVEDDRVDDVPPGPGPTSRRYESRRSLPLAVLEIRGGAGEKQVIPLERVLTLVGGSQHCAVRLPGPGISRFICALLLTPAGVWTIDLLSSQGLSVNGAVRREALLEDGDGLRVGALDLRITYGRPARAPDPAPPSRAAGTDLGHVADRSGAAPLPSILMDRPELLLSEAALRPLLEGSELTANLASSPFGQALIQLIRLLGEMHRDHLQLVREELEQIGQLQLEMDGARAALGRTGPATPTVDRTKPAADVPGAAVGGDESSPEPVAPRPRLLEPADIQNLVGERLAAWEEERQGRWQRVIELLVKR